MIRPKPVNPADPPKASVSDLAMARVRKRAKRTGETLEIASRSLRRCFAPEEGETPTVPTASLIVRKDDRTIINHTLSMPSRLHQDLIDKLIEFFEEKMRVPQAIVACNEGIYKMLEDFCLELDIALSSQKQGTIADKIVEDMVDALTEREAKHMN